MAKGIPYGIKDFVNVIENNRYYVDKTMYIPKLEDAGNFLFFIRPRRFGKSLLLSMLAAYYDLAMADRFQKLFGNLYIGQHPTEEQGKYQVLMLDYSQINADAEDLRKEFDKYNITQLQLFLNRYKSFYSDFVFNQAHSNTASFGEIFARIAGEAKNDGYHLYLILDEYDNFTNNILSTKGHSAYHELTHATGFYREIFKKFKANFERIIMTGVSPVTLDDLSSGYNIGLNISNWAIFNHFLGFSTDEVRTMFNYYQQEGVLKGDVETMIAEMEPWYDNYCFSEDSLDEARMFNSDMVLYYLTYRVRTGKSPMNMVDNNAATDYRKLKRLVDWDQLDESRRTVVQRIIEEGNIKIMLKDMFSAEDILESTTFPSLLYYYGMLTIIGKYRACLVLGIPNNNARILYYEYMQKKFKLNNSELIMKVMDLFGDMAYTGDWKPLLDFIAERYATTSCIRDSIEGERNIQGFMLGMLSFCPYYLVAPEVELNHGFCDFFFLPDHSRYKEVAHSYILELKYLSAKDYDAKCEEQWDDAVKQIHGYAQGPRVQTLLNGTQLHCIVAQFKGWEMVRAEEV